MKNTISVGLEGRYKLIASKPDGTERVVADWFENLILDGGLNRLGSGEVWSQCQVGSGSTAPAVGQTALVALVGSTTTVTSTLAGTDTPTNTYAWARQTYRFAEGVADGNLSEVGIGWGAGLFSRSLIKDDLGDPTTITILADEVLDVVYEVRAYPVMSDQVFTLTINAINYDFTVRPVRFSGNQTSNNLEWPVQLLSLLGGGAVSAAAGNGASAFLAFGTDAALAAVTASNMTGTNTVAGSSTGNSTAFLTSYVNNSYERVLRQSFGLAAGSAPFGGFVVITRCGNYQMTVTPALPKAADKIITLDFKYSWARRP